MTTVVNEDPAHLLERFTALPAAQPLLERLAGTRTVVYAVGGAVRDLMLGLEPLDLDLVVEGELAPLLDQLGADARLHDRFGTATVELGGRHFDLARARRETYSHPGALPSVAPASLEQDLARRDFSVNAVALAVLGPRRGRVAAVGSALEDLRGGTMRVLHDASFRDDPTRLLRLARYASRLGFEIERRTLALLWDAVGGRALGTVSGSRVGAEVRLLAREQEPIKAFRTLRELGIDAAIEPNFGLGDADLAERAVGLLPDGERRDLLVLALAARGVAGAELERLLEWLAFEAGERDAILAAATRADPLARQLADATRPSQVAAAASGAGPELVALAGALGPAEAAREWLASLRHVKLEIDGADLLAAGLPEGPGIGRGLRAALAAKLDGRASGPEAELAQALAAVRDRLT
jgi:tRNA nucleotidyltransferase (CCA-adding enzyme)